MSGMEHGITKWSMELDVVKSSEWSMELDFVNEQNEAWNTTSYLLSYTKAWN